MIRYPTTKAGLIAAIEEQAPGWIARAKKRTAEFRRLGRYEESSSIWSEIKPVYMRLQGGSKCAFCERKFESEEVGLVELDVEHFRPKSRVTAWTPSPSLVAEGFEATDPPTGGGGYHLLAYHPFNYAVSCKTCNSTLKGDRFPIAGRHRLRDSEPSKMSSERPYLLYPIGSLDPDPETLIGFVGLSPTAIPMRGVSRLRALATLEFFSLDDVDRRKNLFKDRAMVVIGLFGLLEESVNGTPARRRRALELLDRHLHPGLPHLNCARNFRRLHEADRDSARRIRDAAFELVSGSS